MNKEQLLAMGLTEEQANKVMESLDGNFVTKTRFNALSAELNQAKETLKERDEQLETLRKSTEDSEGLKKQITELQETNKTQEAEHAAEIKRVKRGSLDEQLLLEAKAKNVTAAKALLTAIDESVDDEGYKALRLQQIEALTKTEGTKFLFGESEGFVPKGAKPGESGGGSPNSGIENPFADKTYDVEAQAKLFKENPEQARALAKMAGIRLN
jgi:hypothetical protein